MNLLLLSPHRINRSSWSPELLGDTRRRSSSFSSLSRTWLLKMAGTLTCLQRDPSALSRTVSSGAHMRHRNVKTANTVLRTACINSLMYKYAYIACSVLYLCTTTVCTVCVWTVVYSIYYSSVLRDIFTVCVKRQNAAHIRGRETTIINTLYAYAGYEKIGV